MTNTVPTPEPTDPDLVGYARTLAARASMLHRAGLERLAVRADGALARFQERHGITADQLGDPMPELGDEYDGHPIVDLAWRQVRAFGDDIDQTAARRLLAMWQYGAQLSTRERDAVVRRFPQ